MYIYRGGGLDIKIVRVPFSYALSLSHLASAIETAVGVCLALVSEKVAFEDLVAPPKSLPTPPIKANWIADSFLSD